MKVVLYRVLVVVFFLISLGIIDPVVAAPYPVFSQAHSKVNSESDRNQLKHLLRDRNLHPENSRKIDDTIERSFGKIQAVMVLDLSGFSKTTVQEGIIATLAMIQKMDDFVVDIIAKKGGDVVKFQADDVYAVFPTVEQGVAASLDILETLKDTGIRASMGIGYGKLLMLDGREFFGNELNLAAKLGEDIAEPQEILLTESAFAEIKSSSKHWKRLEKSLSGLKLTFYKFIPHS